MAGLEEICPSVGPVTVSGPLPHSPPIYLASVYRCSDPEEAEQLLAGKRGGYIYQRDAHPNGEWLAQKLQRLHGAAWALMASSGMAALSAAVLSRVTVGDRVAIADQLYGRSTQLFVERLTRLGIGMDLFEVVAPESLADVLSDRTRLVVLETISNPMLRVADVPRIAAMVSRWPSCQLLVDNTFATPWTCQPLRHGANLVLESVSKMLNGHSDCMLGLLCGDESSAADDRSTMSIWGLSSGPMECWLAQRGVATFALRMERAGGNAAFVAEFLQAHRSVAKVHYPGLDSHPDREVADRIFESDRGHGNMVTFDLDGDRSAVARFMAASEIPFCPSLGEVATTLSHPASTSHRLASSTERSRLVIREGTIRLSTGCESAAAIQASLERGLAAV